MKWNARRFNRVCNWVVAIAFVTYALILPRVTSQAFFDFPQYYSGGLMARYGAWDALYPISKSHKLNAGWSFGSSLQPRMTELLSAHRVPLTSSRFIQPPPCALLFLPLALTPYAVAIRIWGVLMMLCLWGAVASAGKLFSILHRREHWMSGAVMLAAALSPRVYRFAEPANISLLIAMCIGVAMVELVNDKDCLGPVAIALGATIKYFTLPLVIVYAVLRRWNAIAIMLMVGMVLIAIPILIMGTGVWRAYFELSRTFDRPFGADTLVAAFREILPSDANPATIQLFVRLGFCVPALLLLTFLMLRRRAPDPFAIAAFAGGLVSIALLASPIYWGHYSLFLLPAWGWLAAEALAGSNRVRAIALIAWVLLNINLPLGSSALLSQQLWGTMLILAMSFHRVACRREKTATVRTMDGGETSSCVF